MRGKWRAQRADRGAHAARGFVGGATPWFFGRGVNGIEEFQCRTRLCGWCNRRRILSCLLLFGFNAARGFVGGATIPFGSVVDEDSSFNAARGFVGGATLKGAVSNILKNSFNAARGFVGGATRNLGLVA